MKLITDRKSAGQLLAHLPALRVYAHSPDTLILALPRGGVPLALELSITLHLPFNVFLVRKLGVPHQEELAMGAIAEGNICLLDEELIHSMQIATNDVEKVKEKEILELNNRKWRYRGGESLPDLTGYTILLVDDGMATGATMQAAIMALQNLSVKKIVVAIPVASKESVQRITPLVSEVVCLFTPHPFYSVGQWYEVFDQLREEEVIALLGVRGSGKS